MCGPGLPERSRAWSSSPGDPSYGCDTGERRLHPLAQGSRQPPLQLARLATPFPLLDAWIWETRRRSPARKRAFGNRSLSTARSCWGPTGADCTGTSSSRARSVGRCGLSRTWVPLHAARGGRFSRGTKTGSRASAPERGATAGTGPTHAPAALGAAAQGAARATRTRASVRSVEVGSRETGGDTPGSPPPGG